jgi:hypothetical protein
MTSDIEDRLHAEGRRRKSKATGIRDVVASEAVAAALNALYCSLKKQYDPQDIPGDVLAMAVQELAMSSVIILYRIPPS